MWKKQIQTYHCLQKYTNACKTILASHLLIKKKKEKKKKLLCKMQAVVTQTSDFSQLLQ